MSKPHALDELALASVDYKHVEVPLIGHDGNIFAIIGTVSKAIRRAGASRQIVDAFQKQVTSADSYHAALAVVCDWITVADRCTCGHGGD